MENTPGHDDMLVFPDEILGTIVSFIVDTKTVLNVAKTCKRLNKLLHSNQFWCQNGGDEFNKYAAYWTDRIPSHIVDVIVYSKSGIYSNCSCEDKIDELLPNLIPKILTCNNATEKELNEVDEMFSCIFCDDKPCLKFVFGGLVPKYIHFLSEQSTPSLQRSVLWMLRRLCSDSHFANVVVKEDGLVPLINAALQADEYGDKANDSVQQNEMFQLIQMMKKSINSNCKDYARLSINGIVRTCPYTADPVLQVLLEQKFPALNTAQYDLFIQLLTPCIVHAKDLDPRKLISFIKRVVELMANTNNSLVENGVVFQCFAAIVAKSHSYPSVIELMLNDDVIQRGVASLRRQGNAEACQFFTEILKYDASLTQRIRNEEILQFIYQAPWLQPNHFTYLIQLLENDKTIESTKENFIQYKFVSRSMAVLSDIGVLCKFLMKFFLVATDAQIQKSVRWSDNDGSIISTLKDVLQCSYGPVEQQKMFREKLYKLLLQWHVELKSENEKEQLEALELVLSNYFGDRI